MSRVNPLTLGVPQYDDPTRLLFERVFWISETTVKGALYGIMMLLSATTVYFLVRQKTADNSKSTIFHIIYVAVMAILGTGYIASTTYVVDQAYVTHRVFPLGPWHILLS